MFFGIMLIAVGIFILYLLIDFFVVKGANINSFGEKWVKKILWLWLPIYGLPRLIKEVILKKKK